ncbi:MAG: AAA family ATPase [Saprospiraceae bacterium]|nr:AAA family ATPase [Saprospiraceae bacterium]
MISADKIKEIVKSQSVLFEGQGQWLKRETDIGSKLISGYVLVLTGVRRSGKSTLLKQFSESVRPSLYLHFDDPRLVEFEVLDSIK